MNSACECKPNETIIEQYTIRAQTYSNDFDGFLESISRFEFDFLRREKLYFMNDSNFWCVQSSITHSDRTCACAVACLHPHNSNSNVVVSVAIHDDMYKYMYMYIYIYICKRCSKKT